MRHHVLIITTAAALCLAACHHKADQLATSNAVTVKTIAVEANTAESSPEYVATIEEDFRTSLGFETAGRLVAVHVREGQTVTTGQLLAETDTAAAASTYRAARATLARAEDGYRRSKQVYDSGSLPEVKWVEIKSQYEQAQAMADIARRALDNCRLTAPCSGVIGSRLVEPGTMVAPGQPVVTIVGLGQLHARLNIPEVDINKIALGDRATITLLADGLRSYQGRVEERSVEADLLAHTYRVRLASAGADKALLPGMVCRANFASHTGATGCEVPRRAIQIDPDGSRFVWIVTDSGTAARRYIRLSDMTATGVIVDSGLVVGDRVVTDGTLKIGDNTPLIIAEQ